MNILEFNEVNFFEQVVSSCVSSRNISTPLSENDLIFLQNAFTTPGLHAIRVKDIQTGRSLIKQLLDALRWYHDVGYLALNDNLPCLYATNIMNHFSYPINSTELSRFFIEDFFYDFLWIEINQELLNQVWLPLFEQRIAHLHNDQIIPVIVVSYDR